MKSYLFALALATVSVAGLAEPSCHVPKEKWISQETFRQSMEAKGYTVKTLKVTNGCYEIYGHDKAGRRVEMSFDPATGQQVK